MLLLGYLLLAFVVAAVIFYAIVALLPSGISLPPEHDDRPFVLPADRRMRAQDIDEVRIPVSLRGYRFAETDDLIDRLAAEIVVRDEELALLRQQSQATHRGLGDPGLGAPNLADPGLADPGLGAPNLADPGLADPGLADPGLGAPGLVQPGAAESERAAARHAESGDDSDADDPRLPRRDGSGR